MNTFSRDGRPIVELVYDYFYSSFEFNLSISAMKITPLVKTDLFSSAQ